MRRKDLIKDYELLDTVNEKGKLRSQVVYVGTYYSFEQDKKTVKNAAKRNLILAAVAWILYIVPLLFVSNAMKTVYVSVPFAFLALPLWNMVKVLLRIIGQQDLLENKDQRAITNTFPSSTFFIIVLSGIPLVAFPIKLLVDSVEILYSDIIFMVCDAIILFIGLCIFKTRNTFKVVQSDDNKNKVDNIDVM